MWTRNVRHKGANTSPQGPSTPPKGPSTPPKGGSNPTPDYKPKVSSPLNPNRPSSSNSSTSSSTPTTKKKNTSIFYEMHGKHSVKKANTSNTEAGPSNSESSLGRDTGSVSNSQESSKRKWSDDLLDDYVPEIPSFFEDATWNIFF